MSNKPSKKIATLRYGEYSAAFKYMVEQGLDSTFILQREMTQRTERIGEKYSPDMVCTPFKTILGSIVEALEAGADTIVMPNGICDAVVANYLNNVGKGKKIFAPIVFQGGVSRNGGVVAAFEKTLGEHVTVDENGHLMGAIGAAIIARRNTARRTFDFSVEETDFYTRDAVCGRCPNNCEIICVYRDKKLIDSWGNRCERGAVIDKNQT